MAKFNEGDIVYFTLAHEEEGKRFVLKVLAMYDNQHFDGEVIEHDGYGEYVVGEFCPRVSDRFYEVLHESRDIMEEFKIAIKNYEKFYKTKSV